MIDFAEQMYWFLYDNDPRHERVKIVSRKITFSFKHAFQSYYDLFQVNGLVRNYLSKS